MCDDRRDLVESYCKQEITRDGPGTCAGDHLGLGDGVPLRSLSSLGLDLLNNGLEVADILERRE